MPPVCPICRPGAFDGGLDVVPSARFCGQHKGHVLRWVFERAGVRLERDADRVARLTFSGRPASSSPHLLRRLQTSTAGCPATL